MIISLPVFVNKARAGVNTVSFLFQVWRPFLDDYELMMFLRAARWVQKESVFFYPGFVHFQSASFSSGFHSISFFSLCEVWTIIIIALLMFNDLQISHVQDHFIFEQEHIQAMQTDNNCQLLELKKNSDEM